MKRAREVDDEEGREVNEWWVVKDGEKGEADDVSDDNPILDNRKADEVWAVDEGELAFARSRSK